MRADSAPQRSVTTELAKVRARLLRDGAYPLLYTQRCVRVGRPGARVQAMHFLSSRNIGLAAMPCRVSG